ncbi:MAG: DNA topoisomerase IV subunit A [Magnetococcales bacterium]|nr:DNA topoisomerase IV subunit A [Magnetococcales bacterium]
MSDVTLLEPPPPPADDETPLRSELENRYLAYALSTIISRSLPDARDGLKPVHRRILFAMRALNLTPGAAFKKSARVVGDVIGKFHPHGDQAAYDAMVRLAQDFAMRYRLVDGQGNFGNIDGDSAAAMRYTEARLTAVARALMEDLEHETVPFLPTYDGSQDEPSVMPARFPNLLANGATGIAVGMATSIPPHNVGEILDACLHLIRKPEATLDELLERMPGPDFPTGGILTASPEELRECYATGKGSLRLRSRWTKEDLGRGVWRLVVTEIPYHVPKSRLIESIAKLITEKKCPFLADVRDESDTELRIVLEPRSRTLDPGMVMAYLFKQTDLESRFPVNLNVLDHGTRPVVMDLKGLLNAWLDHRFQVHTRRARYELRRIGERLHLLSAYLIVHLNIDEVVAIIKEHDEPAPVLMARFLLDKEQAEAILNMRLRSLRRLEEMEIRKEMGEKEARAKELSAMLADPELMWKAIRVELRKTREEFADARRTELAGAPALEVEIKPEHLVQREPLTVILSRKGWVRAMKGQEVDASKLRFKTGDALLATLPAFSTDTISFLSESGKVYSVLADRLPTGKGDGESLTVLFDREEGDGMIWLLAVQPEAEYFITTRQGQGFRIAGADLLATQRKGKQVIVYDAGDRLLHLRPVSGELVAAIGGGRRLLICQLKEFPVLGRGKGVRVLRLREDETLIDLTTLDPAKGVTLTSGKREKILAGADLDPWRGQRATRGAMLPHGFLSGAAFVGTGVDPSLTVKGVTGDLFDET